MQIMPIGGKRSEKFGGLGRRAESVQTDKVQKSDSGYSWHIQEYSKETFVVKRNAEISADRIWNKDR